MIEYSGSYHKARYLYIVKSIRRGRSKAWNKRTMNWVLLTNYFGLGSMSSRKWCQWLGIDPDSCSTSTTESSPHGLDNTELSDKQQTFSLRRVTAVGKPGYF